MKKSAIKVSYLMFLSEHKCINLAVFETFKRFEFIGYKVSKYYKQIETNATNDVYPFSILARMINILMLYNICEKEQLCCALI